jgi:hypothetical protein
VKRESNWACFALIGLVSLTSACSTQQNAVAIAGKSGKLFSVAADQTSFYRYGPQQGNGPDESLPKDTLMTLIRPSFGFCKVHLVSGNKEGYVASEDIKPASPTLIAALNTPVTGPSTTTSVGSVGARERENFEIRSTEPPPPETLPDPDLPPASSGSPPE